MRPHLGLESQGNEIQIPKNQQITMAGVKSNASDATVNARLALRADSQVQQCRPIMALASFALLMACGGSPAPTTSPAVPSDSDRREAQAALEIDLESLSTEEAMAAHEAEVARNQSLESQLGGADNAKQAECERLRQDLAQLQSLQSRGADAGLTAPERDALPAEVAAVQRRLSEQCP